MSRSRRPQKPPRGRRWNYFDQLEWDQEGRADLESANRATVRHDMATDLEPWQSPLQPVWWWDYETEIEYGD